MQDFRDVTEFRRLRDELYARAGLARGLSARGLSAAVFLRPSASRGHPDTSKGPAAQIGFAVSLSRMVYGTVRR